MSRHRARLVRLVAATALALSAGPAAAQDAIDAVLGWDALADWNVRGSHTVRAERYNSAGDDAGSPYPFQDQQVFNELSLTFDRQVSDYETWQGRATGLVNMSDYRSQDRGFVPEVFNLTQEKGDARVPYRLEVGDYLGFFSPRTLQQPLKGAQIELQPIGGAGEPYHSIQLLTGFNAITYADPDPASDYYTGASWLAEDTALGDMSLSWVWNFRNAEPENKLLERSQNVLGFAWERGFTLATEEFSFEGELAQFRGDLATSAPQDEQSGRAENGAMLQLSRQGADPLTYSLRYERYGDDFRPNGAAVTANRRSIAIRAGWRFPGGIGVRSRYQDFTDSLEHAAARFTRTVGFGVTGPVPGNLWPGLTMGWDFFDQLVDNRTQTTNTRTKSTNLTLSAPLTPDWSARLGGGWTGTDDKAGQRMTVRRQYSLDLDTRFALLGFDGTFAPGMVVRVNSGSSTRAREFGPRVSVGARRGAHALDLDYRYLSQNRLDPNDSDVRTHDASARYGFRLANHTFGLEGDYQQRTPDGISATRSYRMGLFWTVTFEKPRRTATAAPAVSAADTALEGPPDLFLLAPGASIAELRAFLARGGVVGGSARPGLVIYETPLLAAIDQPQRLVLVNRGGRLERAAIIIAFEEVTAADGTSRTYDQVEEALLKRYGRPSFTFRRGAFSANLADDVNADRFIRLTEWTTDAGVIRLGIPRRLDRQVRIEVQHARAFPPPGNTRWSVERMR